MIINSIAKPGPGKLISLRGREWMVLPSADEEFRSLLGLVNPEFESYDMDSLDQSSRRKIARHFIQRKRESIKRWLG